MLFQEFRRYGGTYKHSYTAKTIMLLFEFSVFLQEGEGTRFCEIKWVNEEYFIINDKLVLGLL